MALTLSLSKGEGQTPMMTVKLKKRSFTLLRHRTSVALEGEFWAVLEREAARVGLSLSAFVAEVDAGRGERPLASALRLRALASSRESS